MRSLYPATGAVEARAQGSTMWPLVVALAMGCGGGSDVLSEARHDNDDDAGVGDAGEDRRSPDTTNGTTTGVVQDGSTTGPAVVDGSVVFTPELPEPMQPQRPEALDAGPTDAGNPPLPPSICAAQQAEPRNVALVGRRNGDVLLVRADGSVSTLGPEGASDRYFYRNDEHMAFVMANEAGLSLFRTSLGGEVEIAVQVADPDGVWHPFSMTLDDDGAVHVRGSGNSTLFVDEQGVVEHYEDPRANDPVQPDRYFWVSEADTSGWHVVAIRSGVVPLALAFYEPETDTLQTVRHRGDWIPTISSGGRIAYLGETEEGTALIHEGVEGATVIPLAVAYPSAGLVQRDGRIVAERSGVPIAWLDENTLEVTVLNEVIELLDAGARSTSGDLAVLILDGTPRWVVDHTSLESRSLDGLGLGSAEGWTLIGQNPWLLLGDGLPRLWVERSAGLSTVESLGAAELGVSLGEGAEYETLTTESAALIVEDGWPRSVVSLATGTTSLLDLGTQSGNAETHRIDERFLVTTTEAGPLALITPETASVAFLDAEFVSEPFNQVLTSPGWAIGVASRRPVWRVDAEQARVEAFEDEPLPPERPFYGEEWQTSTAPVLAVTPSVAASGELVDVYRDDGAAAAYSATPNGGWQRRGEFIASVDWITAERRPHTWLVQSGPAEDCFCTWPEVTWDTAPAELNALGQATQLMPLGELPPFVFPGPVRLQFDATDECVIVEGSEVPAPSLVDLTTGAQTTFDGFDSLGWATMESATRGF